jgi:hypothetical protein
MHTVSRQGRIAVNVALLLKEQVPSVAAPFSQFRYGIRGHLL